MTTPAKVGNSRVPIRSHAAAVRSSARQRSGGMNSARLAWIGVKLLSRNRRDNCDGE